MERSVVEMSVLDEQVQDQLAKYGSVKEFHTVLWQQAPDETGCNWNAHIERMRAELDSNPRWWHVVPQMRQRFNLV